MESVVALTVGIAMVTMEYAKVTWHRDESMLWFVAHVFLGAGIAYFTPWPPQVIAAQVLVVCASAAFLDQKRMGIWWGEGLSAASSWPVGLLALYAMGWMAVAVAPVVGAFGLRIWIQERPLHWGPSFWEGVLPKWVIRTVMWKG